MRFWLTGKPFSQQRDLWDAATGPRGTPNPRFVALLRANSDLQHRINGRVDAMCRGGLVAETEQLPKPALAGNQTALQAIAYRIDPGFRV